MAFWMPYFEHFITFVIMGTFSSTSDFFNSLPKQISSCKVNCKRRLLLCCDKTVRYSGSILRGHKLHWTKRPSRVPCQKTFEAHVPPLNYPP